MIRRSTDLQIVTSGALPYVVSTPGRSDSGLPVLCFLHGYDEGPPTPIEEGLTRHGPLGATASPVSTTEFIAVAPQLPVRGDHWNRHVEAVEDVVRTVQATHGGSPEQTYLTGFSFGANGVFDLASSPQRLWSALWPVDPTRVPDADPGLPIWLSSGEISRRRADSFIHRLHLSRIHHDAAGYRVYEDAGLDHVGTAAKAYGDDRTYHWLLEHVRQTARDV